MRCHYFASEKKNYCIRQAAGPIVSHISPENFKIHEFSKSQMVLITIFFERKIFTDGVRGRK